MDYKKKYLKYKKKYVNSKNLIKNKIINEIKNNTDVKNKLKGGMSGDVIAYIVAAVLGALVGAGGCFVYNNHKGEAEEKTLEQINKEEINNEADNDMNAWLTQNGEDKEEPVEEPSLDNIQFFETR